MLRSAVATDLDGVLLRSDGTISPRTVWALAVARRSGVVHVVVTGRPASGCRDILAAIGYRGLAVCGHGGQLYDWDRARLLWSRILRRDLVREVVALIDADVEGGLCVGAGEAGLDAPLRCTAGFSRPTEHGHRVVARWEELWARPLAKVLLRHPRFSGSELAGRAYRRCGRALGVTVLDGGTVVLLPLDVDKVSGLSRAARHLGIAPGWTVAFGEVPDDIPMFGWAGYAVAMGNAHPAVRDAADEVTASNDREGVATTVERLFGGGRAGLRFRSGGRPGGPAAGRPGAGGTDRPPTR